MFYDGPQHLSGTRTDLLRSIGGSVATSFLTKLGVETEVAKSVGVAIAPRPQLPSPPPTTQFMFLPSQDNTWLWIGGIGLVGLGAYIFMRQRS